MRTIIERYNIKIDKKGFCCCPFHHEKTASMKIYKDSYNCFGCGANGDIFSFIQNMEHCDFKTAFYSLGGTYQKPTFESNLAIYKAKKAREKREKKERDFIGKKRKCAKLISMYMGLLQQCEPTNESEMSEAWEYVFRKLEYQIYLFDYYTELMEKG